MAGSNEPDEKTDIALSNPPMSEFLLLPLKFSEIYARVLKDLAIEQCRNHEIESKYERTILSEEAQRILVLIWKRHQIGDENGLSVYGIAVSIAQSPSQLAALNSRVRNIVIAAKEFGLLERVPSQTKKFTIVPTSLLDTVMHLINERFAQEVERLFIPKL